MEPRIMLAADAGAAVSTASTISSVAGSSAQISGSQTVGVQTSATGPTAVIGENDSSVACPTASTLVIVDPSVADDFDFSTAIPEGADIVVLDRTGDAISQITRVLSTRSELQSVHLISHGKSAELQLCDQTVDLRAIASRRPELGQWQNAFVAGGDLLIYGCDVGAGDAGRSFLSHVANLTGLDVAGSNDRTGASPEDANWELEVAIGAIENASALDPVALARFDGALSIQVYAAGDLGDEIMELQIGNDVVGTWNMSGTAAGDGLFGEFNVDIENASIDDIRINFTNDLWQPATGVDRNLRVDRIVVDGVTYEAEDPSVFSTGSWLSEDGIVSGFRQSEYLNANGYFQFTSPAGSGTTIRIDASGETGQETMRLLIDGNVAQTYENVSS